MQLNLLFYGVVSVLYLFGAGKIVLNSKKVHEKAPGLNFLLIALGFITHFWLVQSVIFPAKATLVLGPGPVLSAVTFFAVLIAFFGAIYANAQALLAIVLAIGSVSVWLPECLPAAQPLFYTSAQERMQWALAIVACSLVLLALGKAMLAGLKLSGSVRSLTANLDSPEALTDDIAHMVLAAALFLTISVAGQMLFSETAWPLSGWLLVQALGCLLSWVVWLIQRFAQVSVKSRLVIFLTALFVQAFAALAVLA